MQYYVVGFAFNENKDSVVLIEKQKPEWQKGFLNGVGGKVEAGESFLNAMVREFREETGVTIEGSKWYKFGNIIGVNYEMHCFRSFTDDIYNAVTTEGETIYRLEYKIAMGSERLISSLQVLLPMAIDEGFYYAEMNHIGKS